MPNCRNWRSPRRGLARSTAALTAAQVMPSTDEEPLAGPACVLDGATQLTDADRQAAFVTGIAWGVEDAPFVDAVRDAVATSGTFAAASCISPAIAVRRDWRAAAGGSVANAAPIADDASIVRRPGATWSRVTGRRGSPTVTRDAAARPRLRARRGTPRQPRDCRTRLRAAPSRLSAQGSSSIRAHPGDGA